MIKGEGALFGDQLQVLLDDELRTPHETAEAVAYYCAGTLTKKVFKKYPDCNVAITNYTGINRHENRKHKIVFNTAPDAERVTSGGSGWKAVTGTGRRNGWNFWHQSEFEVRCGQIVYKEEKPWDDIADDLLQKGKVLGKIKNEEAIKEQLAEIRSLYEQGRQFYIDRAVRS